MLWHLFLVHDDYGTRVGKAIGITAAMSAAWRRLPKQVLTEEDRRRLQKLGNNGDRIDPTVWGQWTSSVKNREAARRRSWKA